MCLEYIRYQVRMSCTVIGHAPGTLFQMDEKQADKWNTVIDFFVLFTILLLNQQILKEFALSNPSLLSLYLVLREPKKVNKLKANVHLHSIQQITINLLL